VWGPEFNPQHYLKKWKKKKKKKKATRNTWTSLRIQLWSQTTWVLILIWPLLICRPSASYPRPCVKALEAVGDWEGSGARLTGTELGSSCWLLLLIFKGTSPWCHFGRIPEHSLTIRVNSEVSPLGLCGWVLKSGCRCQKPHIPNTPFQGLPALDMHWSRCDSVAICVFPLWMQGWGSESRAP
jgi:hypothetical protein